jgi:hypothetical protein
MKYYKFSFNGDYHEKEDGTHNIKMIKVSIDNTEIAYGESEEVPEYATEITEEEMFDAIKIEGL